ncbi:unnamed protein product [Pleuronectes platessa]|uniref:Uncharacterized protein n=1 Tax=Pleuronectes platessa TaxID=8262 RepID=A0A9N7YEC5_PLEPL|nr:unnamed protein product [Pleuronectes platessa]
MEILSACASCVAGLSSATTHPSTQTPIRSPSPVTPHSPFCLKMNIFVIRASCVDLESRLSATVAYGVHPDPSLTSSCNGGTLSPPLSADLMSRRPHYPTALPPKWLRA